MKDITNKKFGKLKAIKHLGKNKWQCKCDCCNKNSKMYKDYGGRDIKICDEWLNELSIINYQLLKH